MESPLIGSFTPASGARNSSFDIYGTDCGSSTSEGAVVTTPTVQLPITGWLKYLVETTVEIPGGGSIPVAFYLYKITVTVPQGMDSGWNTVKLYCASGAPSNEVGFYVTD